MGPNGAGKSVVGEAIAFVLGGSGRMLRAKNLGALVNQSGNDRMRQAKVTSPGGVLVATAHAETGMHARMRLHEGDKRAFLMCLS